MRKPEGRAAFARYHAAAIDLDGPEVALLAEATAETGAFAVVGVIERDGATLYCTVLYFDGAKGLVGKHRKLMPTAAERLIWGFGDGSTLPVFKTDIGTIGAVICWENYMPALRMHMYHQGVSLYCAPTADDRDTWLPTMQHIAMEGRTFVLTACQYITRAAYGPDHESALGDDPDKVMMRGGSAIIGPLGTVLAGPDFSRRDHPLRARSTPPRSCAPSMISTSPAITPAPMCSNWSSTPAPNPPCGKSDAL